MVATESSFGVGRIACLLLGCKCALLKRKLRGAVFGVGEPSVCPWTPITISKRKSDYNQHAASMNIVIRPVIHGFPKTLHVRASTI
jgi:hypothetical protein